MPTPILSNKEILAIINDDSTYKSFTSKLTDEIFKENGFEMLRQNDYKLLSDFFGLSMRVYLNKIDRPNARIPKLYTKVVEEYANEKGAIAQRISIAMMKPVDPKFTELVEFGSVDPFIIRKSKTKERFFRQNFNYQNFRTVQTFELKQIFLDENGISEFAQGLLASFDESYNVQKYEMMREMISLAINSTNNPLKDTQKITVPKIDENATEDDQSKYLQIMNMLASAMETSTTTGEFNAYGFEHGCYLEDYVLMVRANVWNKIKTGIMATTYHNQNLSIKFDVEEVKDFGGIIYVDSNDNELKPVHNQIGEVIGFNVSGEGEPLPQDQVFQKDPNANISAVLIQRGAIFSTKQNPYVVKSIENPRGEYVNFFANEPNGSFNYDCARDIIIFPEEE